MLNLRAYRIGTRYRLFIYYLVRLVFLTFVVVDVTTLLLLMLPLLLLCVVIGDWLASSNNLFILILTQWENFA